MAAATLGATAARADWDGRQGRWEGSGQHAAVAVRPQFHHQGPGRWELQTVQRWVEGRMEQRWVEPVCYGRRHWRRCTEGGYQNVWVPGHYEDRQEWVWVAPPARHHARFRASVRF